MWFFEYSFKIVFFKSFILNIFEFIIHYLFIILFLIKKTLKSYMNQDFKFFEVQYYFFGCSYHVLTMW